MMLATDEELACLVHNNSYSRLICLNDVKARLYLPVTIFLSVLIIVGTLGNTTVCLVYWRRRSSRVSSNYFILSLAVLDLVTCVVGMPTEIADLLLPYTFQWPLACKILRFTHSSTIIASSTILIEVAFDRYYRICHLGRQFTAAKAKLLCLGASFLGIVCAWPTFILFGKKTVIRDLGGVTVTGSDCSTADGMRSTIFPIIYYLFLFLLFGLTITFFAVLYTKIGLAVLNRKRVTMVSYASTPSTSQNKNQEKNTNNGEEGGESNHDKCVKVSVNIMDASSSEMSSEHPNDPYTTDDPGDIYRSWPPGAGGQEGAIGRSVSASTILSSLAGSLRRPGKRRSHRVSSSHTRWFAANAIQTSQRCSTVSGKGSDKVRDSVATVKDSLDSSDDKSKSDILSRAASLNKVITETHNMNVENYRNRCFTQSDMNMNKEKPRTTIEQRLHNKSHSDRESLYIGINSGIEEGLLESLQKFNFDFNRTFNVGDCEDKGDATKATPKTQCPQLSAGMDKSDAGHDHAIEDKDCNISGGIASTGSKLSNCREKETAALSNFGNSNLLNASNLSYASKQCTSVNGCSKEFINQLNVYVSNPRLPLNSCKNTQQSQDELTPGQQNQDELSPVKVICDNTTVEDNKLDEANQISPVQPLRSQEDQQQDEGNSKEKTLHLLSSSAFRRKFSSVFTTSGRPSKRHPASSTRHSQRQVRVGKTTTVLFAVTLAYILSFLPYLTVMVLRSVVRDLEENLSPVGELAYKLCVKSFFINNAINPIIYSFLNQTFRSDARQMFRRMFGTGGTGGKRKAQVRMLASPPPHPDSPGP